MVCSCALSAQTNQNDVYELVDQMPYFQGCKDLEEGSEDKRHCSNRNLVVYISEYLRYPEKAKALGLEGTVYIDFVVDETGAITNPKLVRDIGGGCGDIALEIVKNMPHWEPGYMDEEPVKVLLNLPIKFSLKNSGIENDMKLTWGTLTSEGITKKDLMDNLDDEIMVRDALGNNLQVVELTVVYKKGRKMREAESRGDVNANVKRLVRKMKRGGEFVLLTTVQYKGKFLKVERAFRII